MTVAGATLALATGMLPVAWLAVWLSRNRRERRRRLGHCLVCGYNLRGNISGTCPECGTPVTPTSMTKGTA